MESILALEAWSIMGGLEWDGLEMVAEMLGADDVELLVAQLAAIRDWRTKNAK